MCVLSHFAHLRREVVEEIGAWASKPSGPVYLSAGVVTSRAHQQVLALCTTLQVTAALVYRYTLHGNTVDPGQRTVAAAAVSTHGDKLHHILY